MHPATLAADELQRACDVTRTRRSGPGGQHRNKVETAVVIVHRATGTRAEASERRSQAENLAVAWRRLRIELALAVRAPCAAAADPSPLWQARVRGRKIAVSRDHDDFGPLLAEALDRLAAAAWDAAAAAEKLGVTTSQLVKFLKLETRALAQLNAARRQRGQSALV